MKKFTYPFMVRELHLDVFGHMNHATYLQVFEEARWEMITGFGHGLKKVFETKIGPIILEVNVRYRKELEVRSLVNIETWWESVKHKIGTIRQQMVGPDGTLYADAKLRAAFFDMEKRKIVAPPDAWTKAFSEATGIIP